MEIQNYTESTPESLTMIVEGWAKKHSPSFDDLSAYVLQTHQTTQAGAIRAINQIATLRNWLIGCYIVEYEQEGRDRAKYGDRLLKLHLPIHPMLSDESMKENGDKQNRETDYGTKQHKTIFPISWRCQGNYRDWTTARL